MSNRRRGVAAVAGIVAATAIAGALLYSSETHGDSDVPDRSVDLLATIADDSDSDIPPVGHEGSGWSKSRHHGSSELIIPIGAATTDPSSAVKVAFTCQGSGRAVVSIAGTPAGAFGCLPESHDLTHGSRYLTVVREVDLPVDHSGRVKITAPHDDLIAAVVTVYGPPTEPVAAKARQR